MVEQLRFIFLLDSKAIVFHENLDKLFAVLGINVATNFNHASLLGELKSVGYKIESDLLQSISINVDVWIFKPFQID